MLELAIKKMPRGASFIAFNIAAVVLVSTFVLAPVLSHFSERADDISESASQLAELRTIAGNPNPGATQASRAKNAFLLGTEEPLVSADLQSNLKSIAGSASVTLLSIRASRPERVPQLHMIAVDVELEGSLPAIRQMISEIENQAPFLFVATASLRSETQGDDGLIRADLKVQGAMRVRPMSATNNVGAP